MTEWMFNEDGNIEGLVTYNGVQTKFVLTPPKGRDVQAVGVYTYHNPGDNYGAMLQCVSGCLMEPKLTLNDLLDADGLVAKEVCIALQKFPVFN